MLKHLNICMLIENGTIKKDILIRLTAAMVRLDKIWKSRQIKFNLKYKLYKCQVLSILLYGCETWTLLEDLKRGFVHSNLNPIEYS